MVYLDYSATTPVNYEVLESYIRATKDFMGNPNSLHSLGVKSKTLMNSAIKQISDIFHVLESEIIFTSSATMSNNLALIGTCLANMKHGNHLIVSKLEHPSIYKICDYLETIGFEISYVNNTEEGLIDFDDLKNKIRLDTILVSICAVNSETGARQPLKMLRQIIKKENSGTLLHSDMTQALGKVSVSFHDVDLATISSHKIYGPKGIALLYKSDRVKMRPILYGSGSSIYNPGTPAVPLIVAFSKAIRLATNDIEKRENFVRRLNTMIVDDLKKLDGVEINQTKICIPHILNISLKNIKPETFIHAMEEYDIYLGTNSACSSNELSTSVMAIYNDRKRAMSTIRISLSHLTTTDEVYRFLTCFKKVYQKLNSLIED